MSESEIETIIELIRFICVETGIPIAAMHPRSSLYHDHGCAAQDGWELMEAFKNKFDIEMSESDYSGLFGSEGLVFHSDPPRLEIRHLAKFALDKKWNAGDLGGSHQG